MVEAVAGPDKSRDQQLSGSTTVGIGNIVTKAITSRRVRRRPVITPLYNPRVVAAPLILGASVSRSADPSINRERFDQ